MTVKIEFDLSQDQWRAMEDSVEWAVCHGLLSEEEAYDVVTDAVVLIDEGHGDSR